MTQPVGVILAAGLASRMGRPKQLLPYRGTTVLGAVVVAARASRLERLIVVLGAAGHAIEAAVDTAGIEVVHNPHPERGNMSSLLTAVELSGEAPVLLLMGDMPGLHPDVIDAHLEAWDKRPAWMRVTAYDDGRGHPLMLSPELVAELPRLRGPKALWALTKSDRLDVLEVTGAMPVDVDTPDDYRAALDRAPASPSGEIEVEEFTDQYEEIAPLYGVSPEVLRERDGAAAPPRWIATQNGTAIGSVTARTRPDDRTFVAFGATDAAAYGPLSNAVATALDRPLFAVVDEDDVPPAAALRQAGFEIEMVSERFRVRFEDALAMLRRAWLPAAFEIVSVSEVDEERLVRLDNTIRQDVPGTDGWRGSLEWIRREMAEAPPFDPAAYLVAVHQPTGEYAGLVRMWRNPEGPRLGLIGVIRQYRGTVIAAALLEQALTAAAGWGHDTFTTEASLSNHAIYPRLQRLGQSDGRFLQLAARRRPMKSAWSSMESNSTSNSTG